MVTLGVLTKQASVHYGCKLYDTSGVYDAIAKHTFTVNNYNSRYTFLSDIKHKFVGDTMTASAVTANGNTTFELSNKHLLNHCF